MHRSRQSSSSELPSAVLPGSRVSCLSRRTDRFAFSLEVRDFADEADSEEGCTVVTLWQ